MTLDVRGSLKNTRANTKKWLIFNFERHPSMIGKEAGPQPSMG
jgi:hypothetical protein